MSTEFALDLRLARRKSGLTLKDTAHLLDVHPATLSALERGKRTPSVPQVCQLAVIYGRSFQSLFNSESDAARDRVRQQLPSVPQAGPRWLGRVQRDRHLERLSARLADSSKLHGRG